MRHFPLLFSGPLSLTTSQLGHLLLPGTTHPLRAPRPRCAQTQSGPSAELSTLYLDTKVGNYFWLIWCYNRLKLQCTISGTWKSLGQWSWRSDVLAPILRIGFCDLYICCLKYIYSLLALSGPLDGLSSRVPANRGWNWFLDTLLAQQA